MSLCLTQVSGEGLEFRRGATPYSDKLSFRPSRYGGLPSGHVSQRSSSKPYVRPKWRPGLSELVTAWVERSLLFLPEKRGP